MMIRTHPIIKLIKNNQKHEQNTTIQLNTTQITIEPTDKINTNKNYLIIGDKKEPRSIINMKQIIYASQI